MPIDLKARASLNKGEDDKLTSGTLEDLIREFMRSEPPGRREYTIMVGEKIYHAAENRGSGSEARPANYHI
jgi:hypothetical protein